MKRRFLLAGVTALLCLFAPKAMAQSYVLRTLTFEDGAANVQSGDFSGESGDGAASVWSDLIDDPQYNGSKLLYQGGSSYWWHDGENTELTTSFSQPYWSGGEAISNYACNDLSTYGDYDMQLTVYKADEDVLVQTGGGHNGSDNFAVHFGYNGAYYDGRQTLEFADGVARVIDHMYVNNTTYVLNAYLNGSFVNPAATDEDWFKIVATGYDENDDETGSIEFYLLRGNDITSDDIITDWTIWDMHELGAVSRVVFDMEGSQSAYGDMATPGYFAYDDVAVRFPVATPPSPTSYERDVTVGRYGTICLPYAVGANNRSGATFYNVVAQTSEGIILEEETGDLTAGQAYIFYATATSLSCTYSGESVQTPVDASLNNGLQGTFEDNTVVPTGMCFLYNNLLWQSTGSNHVNANRAYLNMTYVPDYVPAPVPGRRRIVIGRVSEEATGIDAIEENGQNGRKEMINGVLYINRNGRMFNAQGQEMK